MPRTRQVPLKLDKLLGAAEALSEHPDRQVAVALADSLIDLHDRVLDAAQRRMMERRLSDIYGPRLHALGFDPRAGAHDKEPAEQQLLRRSLLRILALGARDPAVRSVLLQAARASLTDPAALDTSIRDIAWGVAAQEDAVFADSLIKMLPANTGWIAPAACRGCPRPVRAARDSDQGARPGHRSGHANLRDVFHAGRSVQLAIDARGSVAMAAR